VSQNSDGVYTFITYVLDPTIELQAFSGRVMESLYCASVYI